VVKEKIQYFILLLWFFPKSDIDLHLDLTQVNATHLSALKSLCKCKHLKALFIAFYKKSTIFACVNSLK